MMEKDEQLGAEIFQQIDELGVESIATSQWESYFNATSELHKRG